MRGVGLIALIWIAQEMPTRVGDKIRVVVLGSARIQIPLLGGMQGLKVGATCFDMRAISGILMAGVRGFSSVEFIFPLC